MKRKVVSLGEDSFGGRTLGFAPVRRQMSLGIGIYIYTHTSGFVSCFDSFMNWVGLLAPILEKGH